MSSNSKKNVERALLALVSASDSLDEAYDALTAAGVPGAMRLLDIQGAIEKEWTRLTGTKLADFRTTGGKLPALLDERELYRSSIQGA